MADRKDWIVQALVASEDGTFWTHRGVRPLSAVRAACQNVFSGRRVSGASTITMQAVRLIAPHPKSLWWKWKESVMALKMERCKSKEWIITQYLNRAPFGANFVGVEAAAQGWFGKGAKELGLGEAALLAGMVQAPSRFRPDRHYDRAIRRRDYVLGRMVALGMITEEQREGARSVKPTLCRAPRPFKAPYFCDWAMQAYGAEERGGDFTTTLNADMQERCERAVNAAAEKGGYSVAAIVMKAETGAVLALACSGNYFDAANGQVNTALAPRPAGSTLKPFLTALAMERGVVTPDERLCDVPVAFKGYRPANFDAKYRGLVTVRDSLVLSLNIPFVQMLRHVGVTAFGDCLRGLGFQYVVDEDDQFGLGMAIGNVEVSLMELVSAYAVIARGGDEVFSPGACYLVSDMLSGNERAQAALGHVADVETCVEPRVRGGRVVRTQVRRLRRPDARGREGRGAGRVGPRARPLSAKRRAVVHAPGRGRASPDLHVLGAAGVAGLSRDGERLGARGEESVHALHGASTRRLGERHHAGKPGARRVRGTHLAGGEAGDLET